MPPHYCAMEALAVWTTAKITWSSHWRLESKNWILFVLFSSSPTAQKLQPASSSSLMRGKLWTQGTDMAASKETDANTAAIAGPGGELAFVFSHMPSSNPSKSSGGFSELKENKCLWRDEKVEKRMGFKHVRLLISWVLWLKFVLVASVDDKAFLTAKPTHLQGLILNKKPKLISIFRCRKSKHSYRERNLFN